MGSISIQGPPETGPAAEPWPVDDHTIRIDEMFARQLDNAFAGYVRGLLHDPATGIAARTGEAALEAIAAALPALDELKNSTLSQAVGPRQRTILESLIDTRLDRAAGTIGQLAQRATVEVDDASVADRIAGLNQDATAASHDPAHMRKLGQAVAGELRYQGERRGWDPAETDIRVRAGLGDLYAGAVEAAIDRNDLDGAAALYDHARPVIDPERQAAMDRRFVQAREVAVYRDVDRDMAGIRSIRRDRRVPTSSRAARPTSRPRARATRSAPASPRWPPSPNAAPNGSGRGSRPRPASPRWTGSKRTLAGRFWRYRRTSETGWPQISGWV